VVLGTSGTKVMTSAGTKPPSKAPTGVAGLSWLTDHAWPLWLEHGVDWKRGAFHEHLDLGTLACAADFRRLRVAARQTYVFSKAAAYGVPRAAEAVVLGLDFLRGAARLPDGGYAWRFDLANRPIDRTRDLYDHAFVLLAFAAAASVCGADAARADAVELLHYLKANFSHSAGGYKENISDRNLDRIPSDLPRRQNPHMHLFEACLAADEAFGGDAFLAMADEIAELFLRRFVQAREGALPEFFDADLAPVRSDGRFLVEPGHHYEWVWLLDWYAERVAAADRPVSAELAVVRAGLPAAANALFDFAERHAISPDHGLVVNAVWSDGAAGETAFRMWPQTERLKAQARLAGASRPSLAAPLGALEKHLADAPAGLWIERLDSRGKPLPEPAPATSLYHLSAAITDRAVVALA
jgi:mannose/cellobiose epimerase-like protein (N-acyl-D-glucosamine 2-epimerase family)